MIMLARLGFAAATLLTLGFGAGTADAFVARPATADVFAGSFVTPVAMCGRTCRGGGRYIPGPPEVCYQNGLEYCGPSRGPAPGAGVYVAPGVGIGIGPGGPGIYVATQPRCRTVWVERWDGSMRRVTRCD
jgi:hypothetical protein